MTPRVLAALAAALIAVSAQAQDGKGTLSIGAAFTHGNDAASSSLSGSAVLPSSTLSVGGATALRIDYEYAVTPNIGVQLMTALGGSQTFSGAGAIASSGAVFKADQWVSNLFVNYHFFSESNALRPYLGIGLNYTSYSGFTSYRNETIDVSDSWALATQAGVRYDFDRNWSVFGNLGLSWSKSDVTLTGTGTQSASLDFRPVVVTVGVGYRF